MQAMHQRNLITSLGTSSMLLQQFEYDKTITTTLTSVELAYFKDYPNTADSGRNLFRLVGVKLYMLVVQQTALKYSNS